MHADLSQTTDATSAPSGLADRLFGCPCNMGPSNALADEEELRPLMTDFASGPLDREPPCRAEGFAGLAVLATTVAASGRVLPSSTFSFVACAFVATIAFVAGAAPMTDSVLPRSVLPPRLLELGPVSPLRAMAAPEVMGADTDRADFRSAAEVSVRPVLDVLRLAGCALLKAMAAEDLSAVDCDSTDANSAFGLDFVPIGLRDST